jgi:hypothetical protein
VTYPEILKLTRKRFLLNLKTCYHSVPRTTPAELHQRIHRFLFPFKNRLQFSVWSVADPACYAKSESSFCGSRSKENALNFAAD